MRLIKVFEKEDLARHFSLFLQKEKIENSLDTKMDKDIFSYQVWVHDEDKIQEAQNYLEEFEKDPKNKKFDVSLEETISQQEKMEDNAQMDLTEEGREERIKEAKAIPSPFNITFFILIFCVFIYLINYYQEKKIQEAKPNLKYVFLTPIQSIFLFDTSYFLQRISDICEKYQIDPRDTKKPIPKEAQQEIDSIYREPFWKGIYGTILLKRKYPDVAIGINTLFGKIRKGQVWRLFTPCLFHKNLLHLLFNMIWLWFLGKQIEQRLSKLKYIFLILIVGIGPNICQYLMSGPDFIGYSGVVMGMVGFIWSRQKKAPWEGYPMQKVIFLFIGIYVLLMFVLSFFSFITQVVGWSPFTPNIANTAHITGALIGWFLGRFSFFAWSPKHEC